MSCQETESLIHGYLDDELDLARSIEIERHLESCAACNQAYQELVQLRAAIRSAAPYYTAPASLRPRPLISRPPVWLAACAAAAALSVIIWKLPANNGQPELVADHIRSLMANHLTDVPSTDQHTVKPWFNGKLDFSPQVKEVEGFVLTGGRLDYLNGRQVAAVVYRRRQHIINLFIWPAQGERAEQNSASQGYNTITWTRGGMSYAAVSDLNAKELA